MLYEVGFNVNADFKRHTGTMPGEFQKYRFVPYGNKWFYFVYQDDKVILNSYNNNLKYMYLGSQ